jgi:formate dehydrogenase subunit gamma
MQPVTAWKPELASEIIASHAGREGALLPILHDLQHTFGWVPDDAVPLVALALNLSRAEVHGVLTFYHDYRRQPAGRHVVKLCQAEACQARGSRALTAHAEGRLGVSLGETTPDGQVTLEPIYCLGLCASGPAALIDGRPVARLSPNRIDKLLESVAQ